MKSPAAACPNQPETLNVQQVYHDHYAWLQAWLRRRLGCSQQAADLAQDTFLRLICQPQGDRIREPRAWLTTVAHGLMVNHWRRKDIENAYLQVLAEQEFHFSPSLEQQAMVVDALLAIDQMLATLPGKVRQAFLLVHLDGLTYRQVAEQLAVSERMVKKYMAQAMLNCLLCQDL